jgi:hypothetical protein
MPELPRPIAEFLFTSMGLDRSPAYLEVSADGGLVDWGGPVERYGLTGLERGSPAADQVVVLRGLLPAVGREMCLPCVRMGDGAPADVYLFRDQNTDWVLLLDASLFDRRLRSVQQAANDGSLDRQRPHLYLGVLRALDMVVLAQGADGALVPLSDVPSWLHAALPAGSRFVENFMVDAEALWRLDREGVSVRSGPWHEDVLMPWAESDHPRTLASRVGRTPASAPDWPGRESGTGRAYGRSGRLQQPARGRARRVAARRRDESSACTCCPEHARNDQRHGSQ